MTTQPPVSGDGQDDAPDPGTRSGEFLSERDPRLASFAKGGSRDTCGPCVELAAVLWDLSGTGWRCPGATDDELTGVLGRWQAIVSWAEAAKLGVIRELIRRRAMPGRERRMPGELPDMWEDGLTHELAAALGISLQAADKLALLAWELEARLPGIGVKLTDGIIDVVKARIIVDEFAVLDDKRAAEAGKLIVDELAGATPGQIGKLAARLVDTVDPDGSRKRRERAERYEAQVAFRRGHSGAAALDARGLPTDQALIADASIGNRAAAYKKAGVHPDALTGQLRVLALLDKINGITLKDRVAREARGAGVKPQDGTPAVGAEDDPAEADTGLPARANLTFPLATLLGLAERPGESHGFGSLDPALCRDLADAAARSPNGVWCVTVTDENGYAIGHGCARPARSARADAKRGSARKTGKAGNSREAAEPSDGSQDGSSSRTWAFTRRDTSGPPGGYGTWTLTLPGGREFIVELGPVPLYDCDHRHESHAYQPGGMLRHLVQVRDGDCTFVCCSRHARESDFEHAIPYDKGGRTCACNAGARSRRCHRVKQSKGWTVTQPRPGWHQWTTPSGRSYTQGPKRYPA
jgi:hypothetical protein